MRSSELYCRLLSQLRNNIGPQADKPDESPESTLDALWLCSLGRPASARTAQTQPLQPPDSAQVANLESLVQRRIDGAPLAHLTGRQHFMGMEMLAGPDALVPRAETEILAGAALRIGDRLCPVTRSLRLVDVCTGSGNIALMLAQRFPEALVGGSDLSEAAIALAKRNASHLGLSARVAFRVGDLLNPFHDDEWRGKVDLLTCNPPYISSAKVPAMPAEIADHEPVMAFDGGPFGVSILMRLLREAPDVLRSGGWLAFEVGLGQGPAMQKRLGSATGFRNVELHRDANGQIRSISAQLE